MTGTDYIDTSIYLALIFEERGGVWDYLRLVGYKQENKGLISGYVLGELLNEILHEIRDENPRLEMEYKKSALELVDEFVTLKERENSLSVVSFEEEVNSELLKEFCEADRNLSYSDALHLVIAVQNGCQRFVTTEENMFEMKKLRKILKKRGMVITQLA